MKLLGKTDTLVLKIVTIKNKKTIVWHLFFPSKSAVNYPGKR
jgi:hypothetical protein